LVAETIDVDAETLRVLNPSLLRLATPEDPSFELHLPQGTAEKFSAEIADIPPDKWVSWRRHRVESGETLISIAKKYRVTAAAIADANSLERTVALDAGEKLIIPATQPQSETKRRLVSYRVRRGDTFLGIADRFNVSADDLRKWNRLKANRVGRGMVLRLYTVRGTPEASPARGRSKSKKKPSQPAAGSTASGAVAANHN
jgi:membrane-bound lytic murein transglycosylase D